MGSYRCFPALLMRVIIFPDHYFCQSSKVFFLHLLLVTFQVLLWPFPSHSGLSFPKLSCSISCPFSSITFCPKIPQFHLPQDSWETGHNFWPCSPFQPCFYPSTCTNLYSQLCLILLPLLKYCIQSFPFIPTLLEAPRGARNSVSKTHNT